MQTPMTKPLIIKLMAEVEPTRSQRINAEKFSNNDRIDHGYKTLEQKSHQHGPQSPEQLLPGFRLSYLLW